MHTVYKLGYGEKCNNRLGATQSRSHSQTKLQRTGFSLYKHIILSLYSKWGRWNNFGLLTTQAKTYSLRKIKGDFLDNNFPTVLFHL